MRQKATERLIDSVWTLEYEILDNGMVEIYNFTRDDEEGYSREKELPRCAIEENEWREVQGIYISEYSDSNNWANKNDSTYYEVSNKKHIFSYENSNIPFRS